MLGGVTASKSVEFLLLLEPLLSAWTLNLVHVSLLPA